MVPVGKNSCCEIRRQLAEQFAINARLFAEAVVILTRDPAVMVPGEYERLCAAAAQAQTRAESAGSRFREHIVSHGCGRPPAGGYQHSADSNR